MDKFILVGVINRKSVLLSTSPVTLDQANRQAQFQRERFGCQVVKIKWKPGIEANYERLSDVLK